MRILLLLMLACGLVRAQSSTINGTPNQSVAADSVAITVAPTVVSVSSPVAIGAGTTINVTPPASITNGNVLIALIYAGGVNSETWTPPAGWTQIGSTLSSIASAKVVAGVFCKVAASESGNYAFSFNNGVSGIGVGVILQVTGTTCTTDNIGTATGNATNITISPFALTGTNDLLVIAKVQATNSAYTTIPTVPYITQQVANNGIEFLTAPIGGGTTPSLQLYGYLSTTGASVSNDFVAMAIAFSGASTASARPVPQSGVGSVNSVRSSSGGYSAGVQSALGYIVGNGGAITPGTTSNTYAIRSAAGVPFPVLTMNNANNVNIDGPGSYISLGDSGLKSGPTVLISKGQLYGVSYDIGQDIPMLGLPNDNSLHVGNNGSTGATSNNSRDLFLDVQTGLVIHSTVNQLEAMAVDTTNGVTVADMSSLAAESLTNGALTSGTSWSVAGGFALTSNTAVYTHSGGTGTLTQTSGTLAVAGVGNARYAFTYTVSSKSVGSDPPNSTLNCAITTAFANVSTPLTINANGTWTTYFTATASPGDFVISCTSSGTSTVTLDNLTLKRGTAGGLTVTQYVKPLAVGVASLAACSAATVGARATVNDSNAASFTLGIGAVVAAGGSTVVPVFCNGTNWLIG